MFHLLARWCLARFEQRTRHAEAVNSRVLSGILHRQRRTEYGQRFGFAGLASASPLVDAYKTIVPLSTYADYEAAIDRIAAGEQNVLTSDRVTMLGRSAGTTGRSKRIPRTRRAQGHALRLTVLAAQAVIDRDIPAMRQHRRGINLLSLVAPPTSPTGQVPEISGPNAGLRRLRQQIPQLFTSPIPVFEIAHPATANYLHALFGLRARDALFIETTFASHLMGFFNVIEEHQAELLHDLKHGTLSTHLVMTAAERTQLTLHLAPDPLRAAEVATAFTAGLAGIVPRLWPAMACIKAIASGSFAMVLPRLRWLAGPTLPIHSGTYTASEGIIGLNRRADGGTDYVLAVGAAFFEFIPAEFSDSSAPPTVTLGQLQIGHDYEVVLTTDAGLYRYRLGDVIRITGFHNRAPTFSYQYRRGMLLNVANEKTSEWHALQALGKTIPDWLGIPHALREWVVTCELDGSIGRYAFYLELEPSILLPTDLDQAAARLDRALAAVNEFYVRNGREPGQLALPRVAIVASGTFQALNALLLTRADHLTPTQVKIPRVVQDPDQLALLQGAVVASSDRDTAKSPKSPA